MTTLILDCDGVLAETERDGHRPAFNAAFRSLGLNIHWTAEEYGTLLRIGGGKERLRSLAELDEFKSCCTLHGTDVNGLVSLLHKRKTSTFVDILRSGNLSARPGVARIVSDALRDGWSVLVASTSNEESVRAVVRATLGDLSTDVRIYAGDIVAAKKPAPDIYELAVAHSDARANDTVVIEDSRIGADSATAAGLPHLITRSYYTQHETFPHASVVVDNLGESEMVSEVIADRIGDAAYPISLSLLQRIASSGVQ